MNVFCFHPSGFSQNYELNFGLRQPQDPSTLPVSQAKPQLPERKPKIEIQATLEQVSENEFKLKSGWEKAESEKVTASPLSIFNPKLNIIDVASGERILPVYFSDGYFNLLPGEKRTISVEWPEENSGIKLRVDNYVESLEFNF